MWGRGWFAKLSDRALQGDVRSTDKITLLRHCVVFLMLHSSHLEDAHQLWQEARRWCVWTCPRHAHFLWQGCVHSYTSADMLLSNVRRWGRVQINKKKLKHKSVGFLLWKQPLWCTLVLTIYWLLTMCRVVPFPSWPTQPETMPLSPIGSNSILRRFLYRMEMSSPLLQELQWLSTMLM